MEKGLGLEPGSLAGGAKIHEIKGITKMAPSSPLVGDPGRFVGPGEGIPVGGPEMRVDPIRAK